MLGWRQQTGQTGLLRVGKSALGLLLGHKWQLGKGPMLGGSAITAAKRINNMAPLWDPVRRISIDGAMLWFTEFFKVSKNQGVNRVICHGRLRQTTGTSESQRNQWLSWSIDVYIYTYQDKELHSNTWSSMFSNLANSCVYYILILTHPHSKIRLRIYWSINIKTYTQHILYTYKYSLYSIYKKCTCLYIYIYVSLPMFVKCFKRSRSGFRRKKQLFFARFKLMTIPYMETIGV